MKHLSLTLTATLGLALAGCGSTIRYEDPSAVETLTIDFGSTDLQLLAASMANSMVGSPNLSHIDHPGKQEDGRIMVYMGRISNETSEHIDTSAIGDTIRTKLVQSGRFRLTASDAGQEEIADQVRFQQGSGRVNAETARRFGLQVGSDVVVHGSLISIEKEAGRKEDRYYQFTLEMIDVDSAEVIWIDQKDIRKVESRGLFG